MMKRNIAKRMLAMLLVFCALLPQVLVAQAVDTYYIKVSLEEQDDSSKIVRSESAGYLLPSEKLVPLVVMAINERYSDGSFEEVFASPAMKRIMDEGLDAYEVKVKENDGSHWLAYMDKYFEKVSNLDTDLDLRALMTDFDSTIGDLEPGEKYQMKFKNEVAGDPKLGITYIFTVSRHGYSSGGGGGGGGGGTDTPVEPPVDDGPVVVPPTQTGVADHLITGEHIVFMVGDDKGNFRPDDPVTRAEVAVMFYALLENKNVPITVSFDDVTPGIWYDKAIHTLASLGMVTGVGDNKYEPNRPITRAEFATIGAKFAKQSQGGFEFFDVPKTHWAYHYVSTAAAYGWIVGVGNNLFAPSQNIKRAEAATIVNHMLGRLADKEKIDAGFARKFPDVFKSHWGWYEIAEATTAHDFKINKAFTQETWILD